MALKLFTTLFDNLPVGLIVLDPAGRVVVFNRAEEILAGRQRARVLGRDFFTEIAPCMNVRQLGGEFRDNIGQHAFDHEVEMTFPFPHNERPRDVKVRMTSLDVEGVPHGVLLIEDISLRRSVERMREQLQQLLVHDFKNPLTAIMMNLQLLEELPSVRDVPDAMEAITQGLAASRRLNRMTVDLLDIARLESAELPLHLASCSLEAVCERVRADNATAAATYDVVVDVRCPAGAVAVLDQDLVVRALDNLLENAIRQAKHVTIEAEASAEGCVLSIRDDGPGVPAELRARLFDKYVQVSTPGAAGRGQNRGLGLTFVKLVARQHGGEVELDCPPTGGSTFVLRLPRR